MTVTSEKLFRTVLEMQPKESDSGAGAGVSREEKAGLYHPSAPGQREGRAWDPGSQSAPRNLSAATLASHLRGGVLGECGGLRLHPPSTRGLPFSLPLEHWTSGRKSWESSRRGPSRTVWPQGDSGQSR